MDRSGWPRRVSSWSSTALNRRRHDEPSRVTWRRPPSSTAQTSPARPSDHAEIATRPPATSRPDDAIRTSGSIIGSVVPSTVTRYGRARPRSPTMTATSESDSHAGPGSRHQEVAPGPFADRPIEGGGDVARRARRQVHDEQRRGNLVGRVLHVGADEGEPPAIGRERRPVGVAGQAGQLADAGLRRIGPDHQSWRRGLIVVSGPAVGGERDAPLRRATTPVWVTSKSPLVSCRGLRPGGTAGATGGR